MPAVKGHVTECAAGDFDGNGLPDLVVNRWKRPVEILRNRGGGRFEPLGEVPGAGKVGGAGLSLLLFDYDRDDHLDLLLGERGDYARTLLGWLEPDTEIDSNPPRLFRGLGDFRFEEVTAKAGLNRGFGILDLSSADLNGDGWPDLLLANGSIDGQELQPSAVLLNQGGVFGAPIPVPAWSPATSDSVVPLDGPGGMLVYFNRIGLGRLH